MKRNNPKVNEKQEFRFYKSNLAKVVWDPDNNRALADFEGGSFTTDDIRVAKILLDKGYPQIPVDATEPPDVLVYIPGDSINTEGANPDDIKVGAHRGINEKKGVNVPVVQEGSTI